MSFQIHTPDSAPDSAKETLQSIKDRYGFIPNLAGVFAESPGAFKGLLGLLQANDDESLTLEPLERQIVQLAVATENRCDYCVAAHSMLAHSMGLDRDQIDRIQNQRPLGNDRHEVLRVFATDVVESRGWVDQENLDAFLATGFTKGQVLEILLAVALKTLTNYANHITKPAVNAQFEEFLPRWADAA